MNAIYAQYVPAKWMSYDPAHVRTKQEFIDAVEHEGLHLALSHSSIFGALESVVGRIARTCSPDTHDNLRQLVNWVTKQCSFPQEMWATTSRYCAILREGKQREEEYRRDFSGLHEESFDCACSHREAFVSVDDWERAICLRVRTAMSPPLAPILDYAKLAYTASSAPDLPDDLSPNERLRTILKVDTFQAVQKRVGSGLLADYFREVEAQTGLKVQRAPDFHEMLRHDLFLPLSEESELKNYRAMSEQDLVEEFIRPIVARECYEMIYPQKLNLGNRDRGTKIAGGVHPVFKDLIDLVFFSIWKSPAMRRHGDYFMNMYDLKERWEFVANCDETAMRGALDFHEGSAMVGTWSQGYDVGSRDLIGCRVFRDRPHFVMVHGPLDSAFPFLGAFLNLYPSCCWRATHGDEPTAHYFFSPHDKPEMLVYMPLALTSEGFLASREDFPRSEDAAEVEAMLARHGAGIDYLTRFMREF